MRLINHVKGSAALIAVVINTVFWGTLMILPVIARLLTPKSLEGGPRRACTWIAETWISVNSMIVGCYRSMRWTIDIPDTISPDKSYIINCNHQSWVDIVVLQKVFNRRAPFMRFFIKQQLIYVPILGYCWWALDFPFMRRYSKEEIAKNPELKGKDLESARQACEKFREVPVSMMNFLEGTRFTSAKHERQQSAYQHLLKPKIGGLGQVLFTLGDQLTSLIDVTIVYPDGAPTLWQLLSGKISEIIIIAREVTIPDHLRGRNIRTDAAYREELGAWASELWATKDAQIEQLLRHTDESNPAQAA